MYGIKTDQTSPQPFEAGTMYVVTETQPVVAGKEVRCRAPVVLTPEGVRELEDTDVVTTDGNGDAIVPEVGTLYGLASMGAFDGFVSLYLTGEYFAEGLLLPKDSTITADQLKPAFRKLGIFLK